MLGIECCAEAVRLIRELEKLDTIAKMQPLPPPAKPLDLRPARALWGPGGYLCRCYLCQCSFVGHKRAMWCADCAYNLHPEPEPMTKEYLIERSKSFRKDMDDILQRMKKHLEVITNTGCPMEDQGEACAQHVISMRDLESSIMRQGLCLKAIGITNDYPESMNPESPTVHPVADGLKM